MQRLRTLEERLAESWPPEAWQDITVLLAVSGGADSVALLRAACRLRPAVAEGRLAVAHYNHRLRGEASDGDEAFVVSLCRSFDLPCMVERFEGDWDASPDAGEGLEAAARSLRYDFLLRAAKATGGRLIATAHTADDQVETVLHRILRGTGIAGLAGIPRTREIAPGMAIIRPMLGLRRRDVIAYLEEIGQSYRVDASNDDAEQFTRNRIRRVLLPLLRSQFNATVEDAVRRLAHLAADAQTEIDAIVDSWMESAVRREAGGRVRIVWTSRLPSAFLTRELLCRIWREQAWPLRDMGMTEWNVLAAMARGDDGSPTKRVFPGRIVVERDTVGLHLYPEGEQ